MQERTDKWKSVFLPSKNHVSNLSQCTKTKFCNFLRNNSEIDINGFVGHADLFPYKNTSNDPRALKSMSPTNTNSKLGSRRKQMSSIHPAMSQRPAQDLTSLNQAASAYDFTFNSSEFLHNTNPQDSGQDQNPVSSLLIPTQSPTTVSIQPFTSINIASQQAVLASYPRLDPSQIREESKLTSSLFGTSYTHAISMLDMQGEKVIYFVFSVSNSYIYLFLSCLSAKLIHFMID